MRPVADVEDKRDLPRWYADPMGFAVEPQFGPMRPNLKAPVEGPSQALDVHKRKTSSVNPAPVDYISQRHGPWDSNKQPTLPDYSAHPMAFEADVHQDMHPELSNIPPSQQEMACKHSTFRTENPEDLHRQNVMKKIQEAKTSRARAQAEISHWENVLQVQQHFRPASQRNPREPGTDSKEMLLDDGWISALQYGPEQTQITSPEEQRIRRENLRHESIIPQPSEEKYVCETYSPHVPQWKNKKPGTFDGTGSFKDYMVHFEMIAALNNWSERTKALELATSLRKTALGVLTDLSDDTRYDFQALVSALSTRFEPEDQVEVFKSQLRNRCRKKTESIPELGQDMKRLARLAYPGVMMEMKSWLALECFVDALDNEFMEFQVKQSKPKSIDDAVKVAVEVEAFQLGWERRVTDSAPQVRSQRQDIGPVGNKQTSQQKLEQDVKDIKKSLMELEKRQTSWTVNGSMGQGTHSVAKVTITPDSSCHAPGAGAMGARGTSTHRRACFSCGYPAHLIKDCPDKKSEHAQHVCTFCNRQGHQMGSCIAWLKQQLIHYQQDETKKEDTSDQPTDNEDGLN